MKILITGCKGQLGNELQNIIKMGSTEIGQVSNQKNNRPVCGPIIFFHVPK